MRSLYWSSMASISLRFPAPSANNDRLTGAAVTLAVHLALLLAWKMAISLPPAAPEVAEEAMQWLTLPAPATRVDEAPAPAPVVERRQSDAPPRRSVQPDAVTLTTPETPTAPPAPREATPQPAGESEPALSLAESMAQQARRSAGEIDRTLRKESRPLIVAPLDSPQIRMRAGMEHARAMAPPRMWEAPKIEELVNNTGDGARRTRVITGNRTYCITNRAPTTNVEMIEMHGRQRFTNCPTHEEPAKQQVWRTARD